MCEGENSAGRVYNELITDVIGRPRSCGRVWLAAAQGCQERLWPKQRPEGGDRALLYRQAYVHCLVYIVGTFTSSVEP